MIFSDVWAIGVITYFLLCGYTPFDRDSNLEEMEAILAADYKFVPTDYWHNVSQTARQFINRCLTVDPQQRMTAHEALAHPWISPSDSANAEAKGSEDLLPTVKKNFNARRRLHQAIDTIRAINKLREGGAQRLMNGALSKIPSNHQQQQLPPNEGNGDRMEVEGEPGERFVHQGSDEMDIDSNANGMGQTPEMIKAQEKKIAVTSAGLWKRPG